jgi:hypothetical protein
MATQKGNRGNPRQGNLRGSLSSIRPLPGSVLQSPSNGSKSKMGFLVALCCMVLVFVLLLPLLGSIYYDTLAVQRESKMQIERMERLRQQLEYERKQLERLKNDNSVLIPSQLPDGRPPQNP